jgi:hypothetical protein
VTFDDIGSFLVSRSQPYRRKTIVPFTHDQPKCNIYQKFNNSAFV